MFSTPPPDWSPLRPHPWPLLTALLLGWLLPGPLPSRADGSGPICSIQLENDFAGRGTDGHFTHGSGINCLTEPIPWIVRMADQLPWFSAERSESPEGKPLARASISIAQSIFTPEDISRRELIVEDRPYAGWLHAGFGLVANQGSRRYDKIELDIGVIGPWSLAEEVQESWHSAFDLAEPRGWDNQLKNELGINLFYEQARRFEKKSLFFFLECDFIPHFGGALGNVFTYGAVGFTLRVGPDLREDFGPPRIRPSLPGGGFFANHHHFNWYFFAGVEGRLVLRNIFLDGNTFRDSHSVDKEYLVGDFQTGLAIQLGRWRFSYTQIFRTKEFKTQDSPDEFGAASLSYLF
ncbi:MAG: lipid A deacylase LpxR family protein [Deltaproteobacteria bacterium]|nr:lipid A deacylase LpxR family protein [Deltaproteobacteria bacterium]